MFTWTRLGQIFRDDIVVAEFFASQNINKPLISQQVNKKSALGPLCCCCRVAVLRGCKRLPTATHSCTQKRPNFMNYQPYRQDTRNHQPPTTNPAKMSLPVSIASTRQFSELLSSSNVVIADCKYLLPVPKTTSSYPATPRCDLIITSYSAAKVNCRTLKERLNKTDSFASTSFPTGYADWCAPCKTIAPAFEALSKELSQPGRITFAKVNVDEQQEIAQKYNVSAYVDDERSEIRVRGLICIGMGC